MKMKSNQTNPAIHETQFKINLMHSELNVFNSGIKLNEFE